MGDEATLPLAAEELSVSKEVRETGRVRVRTHTDEREAWVDETLSCEHVEIETVPVGRQVDAAPAVRQEGDTTIIPVVEEVLVVERRLILKEEVHVKHVSTTTQHRESVRLRSQRAAIERSLENTSQIGGKKQ
jgi:uncharacterized protein (TIGR02271 family)